ncbi:MAG: cell wall hydrolase [Lachnospiraceae bacterium]|nr:cell wall hydrolase [Lachnospiraceae bacterium]
MMRVGHRKLLMMMSSASAFMFLTAFAGVATNTENVVAQVEVPAITVEASQEETDKAVTETVTVTKAPVEVTENTVLEQAGDSVEWETLVLANVEESLNIRAEASEESDVVGKLYAGCKGSLLEKKDGWTKISSGEVVGYVKDEYIVYGDLAKELADTKGNLIVVVKTETLRVREEAKEDAAVLGLVAAEDNLVVADKEVKDGWIKVDYDDAQGYVSLDYVEVKYSFGSAVTIEEEMAAQAAIKAEAEKGGATKGAATSLSSDDVSLLAAMIQCEAGNESFEGKVAVGNVILNRVNSGGYPNSIYGVITAPGQFPPATNGKLTSVLASGIKSDCIKAAQTAMSGVNYIGSATHFRSVSSGYSGTVIGNHVFW